MTNKDTANLGDRNLDGQIPEDLDKDKEMVSEESSPAKIKGDNLSVSILSAMNTNEAKELENDLNNLMDTLKDNAST